MNVIKTKNIINDSTLYFLLGHSIRHNELRLGMTFRYIVPKNICFYTLTDTTYEIPDHIVTLFNFGLNELNILKLKALSFYNKTNYELSEEFNLLEKNIFIFGLFRKSNNKDTINYNNNFSTNFLSNLYNSKFVLYRNIILPVLFYLKYNNLLLNFENYKNTMNIPLIDIIKFFCSILNIDNSKPFTLQQFKDSNFSFILEGMEKKDSLIINTILYQPFSKFLEHDYDNELLLNNFTYYDLFKKLYHIFLRRYTENQSIYNYNININCNEKHKEKCGLYVAPYKENSNSIYNNIWNKYSSTDLSTIIIKLENNLINKNIFILGICNTVQFIPIKKYPQETNIIYNSSETNDRNLVRKNSFDKYYNKYLKYKNKYYFLKKKIDI